MRAQSQNIIFSALWASVWCKNNGGGGGGVGGVSPGFITGMACGINIVTFNRW